MAKNNNQMVRKLVVTAMLSALAGVLMVIDFPLTFIAPFFYKLDFSEIPVLIGGFSLGPVAGITIELIKNLIKIVIVGSETGGIGELGNFLVGCALILPASLIYKRRKTRKSAIIGMLTGTVTMAVTGVFLNAFLLIPVYSVMMPLEQILELGKAIVPFINDTFTFCLFCVAPFNLLKGLLVSIITFFLYKPLSRVIHGKV